jgi:hypothetical protein
MKFEMTFRGVECEITAAGYEYSPDIGINGFGELYATRLDNGEPFEMTEDEESVANQRACEIKWEDIP